MIMIESILSVECFFQMYFLKNNAYDQNKITYNRSDQLELYSEQYFCSLNSSLGSFEYL